VRRGPGVARAGWLNDMVGLTDVPGIQVGHCTDLAAATGCTVVLCEPAAVAGVDVRGGAPGSRETDLLKPGSLVGCVDAILLTGGSAFGLAAATGVMRFLEERGRGFPTAAGRVPIVPAAVLYDLGIGRADVRPDEAAGYAACLAASRGPIAEGSVGAGTGATVAKLGGPGGAIKSGIGTHGVRLDDGTLVAALVALNAVGSVVDPTSGQVIASPRQAESAQPRLLAGTSTTLGVVATTARLDLASANRLASVAHDGLARTIRPSHTLYDGDTIFAVSLPAAGAAEPNLLRVGAAATDVVAEAVLRAVRLATGLHGVPAVGR
jgi:L-aminopeptidase/D-esterase-like protein